MHLPLIDFRAYKIGNNIQEQMQLPENARKAEYEYTWTFKHNGEEVVIKNSGAYPQIEGEYVGVETRLLRAGDKPAIDYFLIENNGENVTDKVLNEEKLLLIITYNLRMTETESLPAIKSLSNEAAKKGYRVLALTSSGDNDIEQFKEKHGLDIEFHRADETLLKTIVRANPGILVLNRGTILQKRHWSDAEKIKL
jgi:peroxiredoxin